MACNEIDNETESALFALENISVVLGGNTILSDISMTIDNNGITSIIGPSGSGKSTLLRLLNRLISPSSGKMFFQGEDYQNLSSQTLRKKVGMLQQSPYLFEGTVRRNIEYGPKIWEIDYTQEDIINLLEKVALTADFLDRDVAELSGGEQQRVSLARTLANKPCAILLDEPTSALDVVSADIIEKTIIELTEKDNVKVVIVTHSLDQTKRLTKELVFLKEGKLIEKKSAKSFFDQHSDEEIKSFFKSKTEEQQQNE
jgi:putative ABC transport system ATP-binding protein